MKRIYLTGSSGFIGRHLINALENSGYLIINPNVSSKILDPNCFLSMPKFDVVIHLASETSIQKSFEDPVSTYNNNLILTLHALEMARLHNAKIIYFSSYVYGQPKYLPIDEIHPTNATNPYAQSKIICEKLCEGYNRDFQLPVIIFRPFNIYGFGQNKNFLIPNILDQLKNKKIILNDSRPKRDYLHINDLVRATIRAIKFESDKLEIFNIGFGKSYSVDEVVNLVCNHYGIKAEILFLNKSRKGEITDCVADISKAKFKLDWIPLISLEEGISLLK